MRIFVYALALANLGFWSWIAWFAPQAPEPGRFEGPGLTLLREVERAPAAQVEPEPEPATDATPLVPEIPLPVTRCIGVGPFVEPDDAGEAQALLAAAGFESRSVSAEEEIWDGFWVYVGQLADMNAAREAQALIEAQGIEDAYIIQNSDSGILVSLGVYSDLARAGSLADRVGDLGLDAIVTDRTRVAEAVWLEFEQSDGDASAFELLQQEFITGLEQRECVAAL